MPTLVDMTLNLINQSKLSIFIVNNATLFFFFQIKYILVLLLFKCSDCRKANNFFYYSILFPINLFSYQVFSSNDVYGDH